MSKGLPMLISASLFFVMEVVYLEMGCFDFAELLMSFEPVVVEVFGLNRFG